MRHSKSKKFALYVRKSSESEDRQVLSLTSQMEVLTTFALRNNFSITETFTDSASAHIVNNRPGFSAMVKKIEKGKVDGIICWKLDRLARNPIEDGQIRYFLQNRQLLYIATPQQCYTPEDSTLPMVFELGYANQFSLDLSKNVKRGNATKRKNGGWCGVAPAGYLNDRLNKTVIKDPERFQLVRKMFDLYLNQTHSLKVICEIANNQWNYRSLRKKRSGGNPIVVSTLHQVLSNPFYAGLIYHSGTYHKGNHQAMITLKEHKRVLAIMSRNSSEGVNKLIGKSIQFAYTGLMTCGECGASITAEEKIKYKCPNCNKKHCSKHPKTCSCGTVMTQEIINAGRHYTYYRCTKRKGKRQKMNCQQKCIRKEALESQLQKKLKDFAPSPAFKDWLIKAIMEKQQQANISEQSLLETYKKKLQKIEKQLENLLELTLNGGLEQEEYLTHKKKLTLEKELCLNQLKEAKAPIPWKEDIELLSNFMNTIPKKYQSLSQEQKKRLLQIFGSNPYLTDRRIDLKWVKPIQIILELKRQNSTWLEPAASHSDSDLIRLLEELFTSWQAQADELRTEINKCDFIFLDEI